MMKVKKLKFLIILNKKRDDEVRLWRDSLDK